jgi:hypothetical protein
MKSGQFVVLFLRGSLGGPKPLPFQTLVFSFEGADGCVPGHGTRVVINFVMDLDCFQLEGKDVALQERSGG